jgi:hypothetical protein
MIAMLIMLLFMARQRKKVLEKKKLAMKDKPKAAKPVQAPGMPGMGMPGAPPFMGMPGFPPPMGMPPQQMPGFGYPQGQQQPGGMPMMGYPQLPPSMPGMQQPEWMAPQQVPPGTEGMEGAGDQQFEVTDAEAVPLETGTEGEVAPVTSGEVQPEGGGETPLEPSGTEIPGGLETAPGDDATAATTGPAPIPEPGPSAKPKRKFCGGCGSTLNEGDVVCVSCGKIVT